MSDDQTCCEAGGYAQKGSCPFHDVEPRRLLTCIEEWPECYSGGYDPQCCRWPKSCSCMDWPHAVGEDKLEPAPEPEPQPPTLAQAEEWARWAAVHDDWDKTRVLMGVLLEEYDRRGQAMKTYELGMLAGLLGLGLDKETADRVGDRMRTMVLGPDREPLPRD